jgi:hypothetical protein
MRKGIIGTAAGREHNVQGEEQNSTFSSLRRKRRSTLRMGSISFSVEFFLLILCKIRCERRLRIKKKLSPRYAE